MPMRAIGSGAISFGLVSIPVQFYLAASSESPSFNLLHTECGSRIKQQRFCPVCNKVVERQDLVRGYEFSKNQYVRVTEEELKALEGEASEAIEIFEFVPLAQVDPIYFERSYYLGPGKAGEKPYRLLANAMIEAGKVVSVIDRCFPLQELPEALRYYGEGRSRGKVVLSVPDGGDAG